MSTTTAPSKTPSSKTPKGWPEGVWYAPDESAGVTNQLIEQSATFAQMLLTMAETAEGILNTEGFDPVLAEQARLRAKHAATIAEIKAKIERKKRQIEIDRATKAAKEAGKKEGKKEAMREANAVPMPKSLPTAVEELAKNVINGFNVASEEKTAILDAEEPEDLEDHKQTQRYAPYLLSAQKDRRDAEDIYDAADKHITKLFAPPSTKFDTKEEVREGFTEYVQGVRTSAVALARGLWTHRRSLPKGRSRAKANKRSRANTKKRKAKHSRSDAESDNEDDLFDKEEEPETKRAKPAAKEEEEEEEQEEEQADEEEEEVEDDQKMDESD